MEGVEGERHKVFHVDRWIEEEGETEEGRERDVNILRVQRETLRSKYRVAALSLTHPAKTVHPACMHASRGVHHHTMNRQRYKMVQVVWHAAKLGRCAVSQGSRERGLANVCVVGVKLACVVLPLLLSVLWWVPLVRGVENMSRLLFASEV